MQIIMLEDMNFLFIIELIINYFIMNNTKILFLLFILKKYLFFIKFSLKIYLIRFYC